MFQVKWFNQKKSYSREPFALGNSNNFVIPLDFKGWYLWNFLRLWKYMMLGIIMKYIFRGIWTVVSLSFSLSLSFFKFPC